MPANSKGKMIPNKRAGKQANSKTAGPGGSFPIGDKKHARLAISGATRSEHAGNISPSTEASIKAKARAAFGGGKKSDSSPKAKARAGVDHMAEANRHDAMVDAHRGKRDWHMAQAAKQQGEPVATVRQRMMPPAY